MKTIMAAVAALAMMSCFGSNEAGSRVALSKAGYSNVEITGWSWGSCGNDDNYSTGFKADNPKGDRVSGVVCCGLWKNCTIRF